MKMRISVSIENEDESAFTESTTREFSIPGVEAFTGPEVFDQVFEQYEREALEARNDVMKEATEKYVSEVGKKKTQSELDVQGGELLTRPKEYPIEAEAGQLEIDTFGIISKIRGREVRLGNGSCQGMQRQGPRREPSRQSMHG